MGSVPGSAMNERIRERTDMGGRGQLLFLVTSPIPAQQWSLSARRNISPTARRKIEKGSFTNQSVFFIEHYSSDFLYHYVVVCVCNFNLLTISQWYDLICIYTSYSILYLKKNILF